jgi:hypothetical protein
VPRHFKFAFGLVAALLAAGGSGKAEDVLPPVFVVPKNAVKVVAKRPGWDKTALDVDYQIREVYPADRFIAEVRQHVEALGFKPTPDDGIDVRSEFTRRFRWRSHVLRDPGQKGEFFNWKGEWSNRDGDVVTYFLHYSSAVPEPGKEGAKPDNENLSVGASLQPKRVVPESALAPSLIVLDGAGDFSAWRERSEWRGLKYQIAVRYTLKAPYPPEEIMASLRQRVEKQGWTWTEQKGFGAPGPPNNRAGWPEEKRTHGPETEFVWIARWSNRSREELTYTLTQFATPSPGKTASAPDSELLEVEASLLTWNQAGPP